MAAARSPAPVDGRLPCPLCGGLVHPIAGRCKHCKSDLNALRSTRPAAAATLPALASVKGPATVTPASVAAAAYSGGSYSPLQPAGPRLVIAPTNAAPVDHATILPPRATGRMQAHGTRTKRSSWPMIVIAVAGVAIIVAIVIMLWPPAKKSDAGTPGAHHGSTAEMPAPDRMPTDPNAVTPTPTPPSANGNGFAPPPTPVQPANPPNDPLDPNAPHAQNDPPPDIDDPNFLGQNSPSPLDLSGGGGLLGNANGGTAMLAAMLGHACDRLATCPSPDSTIQFLCQSVPQLTTSSGPAPTCAAAQRCLQQIDAMSCSSLADPSSSSMSTSFLMSAITGMQDCMTAMQC